MPVTVSAISSGLSGLTSAITQVGDLKKRREFEQKIALLSYEDKLKLDKELLKTSSKDAKFQILANTLGQLKSAQLSEIEKSKRSKNIITAFIIVGGAALLLVTALIIKKNKK